MFKGYEFSLEYSKRFDLYYHTLDVEAGGSKV